MVCLWIIGAKHYWKTWTSITSQSHEGVSELVFTESQCLSSCSIAISFTLLRTVKNHFAKLGSLGNFYRMLRSYKRCLKNVNKRWTEALPRSITWSKYQASCSISRWTFTRVFYWKLFSRAGKNSFSFDSCSFNG